MGKVYYNEIDPFNLEWLHNLMIMGAIPEGVLDGRDVRDVYPDDLKEFDQCHFFAGIGVWAYALQQAGWPDDRPIWTGSCPCQPFSSAGRRHGVDDERHLWPSWFHHIEVRRPRFILGEQVASKDGLAWLDLVSSDLEGADYPIGALDTCAAGFGAPHIRQRQFFGAYDKRVLWLADTHHPRPQGRVLRGDGSDQWPSWSHGLGRGPRECGATDGPWGPADWLRCKDGLWRPVEPGTFPLVDGTPGRVGRLRAYGNAIVAAQATAFVESFMEIIDGQALS